MEDTYENPTQQVKKQKPIQSPVIIIVGIVAIVAIVLAVVFGLQQAPR